MPFRTFLGLCLLSTVWGCVSLDYYEALRQAYERSEARNQEAKNELARTSAELTRLQRELTAAGGPDLLAAKEKEIAQSRLSAMGFGDIRPLTATSMSRPEPKIAAWRLS